MEPKIKMETYHLIYMSSLLGDEKSIVRFFSIGKRPNYSQCSCISQKY